MPLPFVFVQNFSDLQIKRIVAVILMLTVVLVYGVSTPQGQFVYLETYLCFLCNFGKYKEFYFNPK